MANRLVVNDLEGAIARLSGMKLSKLPGLIEEDLRELPITGISNVGALLREMESCNGDFTTLSVAAVTIDETQSVRIGEAILKNGRALRIPEDWLKTWDYNPQPQPVPVQPRQPSGGVRTDTPQRHPDLVKEPGIMAGIASLFGIHPKK
jgi:hypothetical protein